MDDPSRGLAQKNRILLVDDDEGVLFVLKASLQRMRCEVVTAQDGRAAYQLLQASAFDLLITDIRLPELDGIILTDLVRSLTPRLPVVWVTAYGCRGLREDATRLRVFRCLEKPVEVEEFRRVVQQAMSAPNGDTPDGEEPDRFVFTGR
jgi:two-component system, NtrC family, response regulator PilR